MKKYLHLLIALTIVLSMVFSLAVPASAATLTASLKGAGEEVENTENTEEEEAPEVTESDDPYTHTQQFLDAMEAEDLGDLCTYKGKTDSGDDLVWVDDYLEVDGEEYDITIALFFADDNESIEYYIWNIIDFNEENRGDVLEVVNELNYNWSYCKFYVDDTDYSVTVNIDMFADADQDVSVVSLDALYAISIISENALPDLLPYAK